MEKQAKIISFANHKGGVGKTTTTASVGSILASMGNKVLLVDMDAQSNLTTSLLKDNQVIRPSMMLFPLLAGVRLTAWQSIR